MASDLTLALRVRADMRQALQQMRSLGGRVQTLGRTTRAAGRQARNFGRAWRAASEDVRRTRGRLVGVKSLIAGLGVGIAIRQIVRATAEQERAVAAVEQAIRNLGDSTGLTTAHLRQMAAGLQQVTTYGDEVTLDMQALLLTFRQIDEVHFERLTETVLDLATALKTGPREAALQVAKALEDPVQGLTALRRSGTVFSEAQTKVIRKLAETNRLAEAQGLILDELERQYGGTARAARDTLGGAISALGNAFGDLFEGADAAGALRGAIEDLVNLLQDPQTKEGVQALTTALIQGFGAALEAVGHLGIQIQRLSDDSPLLEIQQRLRELQGGFLLRDPFLLSDAAIRASIEKLLVEARAAGERIPDALSAALREQGIDIAGALARPLEEERRKLLDALAGARAAQSALRARATEIQTSGANPRVSAAVQTRALDNIDRQLAELESRIATFEADLARNRAAADALLAEEFAVPGAAGVDAPADRAGRDGETADPDAAGRVADEEKANRQLATIRERHEDDLARITLDSIRLLERERAASLKRIAALEAGGASEDAVADARLAADEYYFEQQEQLLRERFDRENALREEASAEAARRRAEAIADIEAEEVDLGITGTYDAAIRDAERWRDATLASLDEAAEGYGVLADRVDAAYGRMVAAAEKASEEQEAAAEGWVGGMREALREMQEESESAAETANRATREAFDSMEDALVEFVRTGKLSFSDLVDHILAELARIVIRRAIIDPLMDILQGILSGRQGAAPGAPTTGGGFDNATPPPIGFYPVGHAGLLVGRSGGVRRLAPPEVFAAAPRYHAGGIAGLLPDEVPIIARRGEGVFTPEQMAALTPVRPAVHVEFINRGTAQREVDREVRFDGRRWVTSIVLDDLGRGGPIRKTLQAEGVVA